MKRIVLLIALVLLPILNISAQEDQTIGEYIQQTVEEEAEFVVWNQLSSLLVLTGEFDFDEDEMTIFLPTDDAFIEMISNSELIQEDIEIDEQIELLTLLISSHIVDDIVLADDLEDGLELETRAGTILTIAIDDDEITVNDTATVSEEIITSNGVIFVVDAVLMEEADNTPGSASLMGSITRDRDEDETESGSGEACIISTDEIDAVQVRVGPGENRTSVTFLATGQDFTVLGSFEDDEGNVWYQLDKEQAAPGRAINEAWVSADAVDSTGDCENIAEASAPPVIPISSNTSSSTTSTGGTVNVAGGTGNIWIDYAPWAEQLPASLRAPSRTAADLIVQATDELINESSCGQYSNSAGQTITVRRYQVAVNVTVISGRTGATLRSQQFIGGAAPGCPNSLAVNTTLNGSLPPLADALPFIQGQ